MSNDTAPIFHIEPRNGVAVVNLAGEIDLANAGVVEAQFESLAERGVTAVVIDASGVTFMDSTGLRPLVRGKGLIGNGGARLFMVPSHPISRLLDHMALEGVFGGIFGSVDEAVAALDGGTDQVAEAATQT